MPGRISVLLALSLLVLSCLYPQVSLACRFNVRETGFVDLGLERYFLFCYFNRDTPHEAVYILEKTAEQLLPDSRVVFETIAVEIQPDHPALKYLDKPANLSLPAVVLVSPDESYLPIPIEGQYDAIERVFEASLRRIVSSSFRDAIVENLVSSYGVVLLIEGADPEANMKASQAAEAAIETIDRQMKFMPKPIAGGPVLMTLKPASFASERILLWSLGIDAEAVAEPHAAVLYGRLRKIGPVLKGNQISEETLYNILSIVGADCECGLDPSLIRGTALPLKWEDPTRAVVAANLGFDPDNPMVMTEVSQILKLRASLYPWSFSKRLDKPAALYDLPVPFVEDTEPLSASVVGDDPVLSMSLYALAGIGGLVVIVVAFMVFRAARRTS